MVSLSTRLVHAHPRGLRLTTQIHTEHTV